MEKLSKNDLNALAADVQRLSMLLTRERGELPAAYLRDPALRKAYLSYFLPANLHKIHVPLAELQLHPKNILTKERLRILDIGSGPGTAVLGALDFFARLETRPALEFIANDQVAENLREAEALFRRHQDARPQKKIMDATLQTVQSGVEGLEARLQGRFDVIILSNILNELFAGQEDKIARRVDSLRHILNRLLADDGSCVIIEPALRETSRELLMVRDGLLHEGLRVFSPCLVNTPCPALDNPKDWCHEDVPWDPPMLVKEIDERIGLRKDSLKFSYVVLRKDGLSIADVCGDDAYRVVSEPLVSKGKMEYYICGRRGRRLVARLDKDMTSLNEAFGRLRRGDLVDFHQLADEGKRFRAGKDTWVTLRYSRSGSGF